MKVKKLVYMLPINFAFFWAALLAGFYFGFKNLGSNNPYLAAANISFLAALIFVGIGLILAVLSVSALYRESKEKTPAWYILAGEIVVSVILLLLTVFNTIGF